MSDVSLVDHIYKHGLIYDIEVYPNLFMITVCRIKLTDWKNGVILLPVNPRSISTYYIYEDPVVGGNSFNNILDIVKAFKTLYWIGFYNFKYDDIMLNRLNELLLNPQLIKTTICNDLYLYSKNLVESKHFKNPYYGYNNCLNRSYDLYEIIRKGYNATSLKNAAVNLKMPKIQNLPYPPDKVIEFEEVNIIRKYNINDIECTVAVVNNLIEEINSRDDFCTQFDIPTLHSQSDSGICKKIFSKHYIERYRAKYGDFNYEEFRNTRTLRPAQIPISSIVFDNVSFQTDVLQTFLQRLLEGNLILTERTQSRDKYDFDIDILKETITFYGKHYSVKKGGIHSEDEPAIYRESDSKILLDLDVTSQYPSVIVNNKLCPQHLDSDIFLKLVNEYLELRVEYKKLAKSLKDPIECRKYHIRQLALKIVLNSIYGLFNSKTFWLFDPYVTYSVTVNNQLYILMLIEMLMLKATDEQGNKKLEVVSANTDGILLYLDNDFKSTVFEIVEEWENITKFKLEANYYDLYVRWSVNDYIARYSGKDSIKTKGNVLIDNDITKGFDAPIVSKAIVNYFVNGIDYKETIYNHRDIYDFCISKKIGKAFKNVLTDVHRTYTFYGKTRKPYVKPKYEDTPISSIVLQDTVRFFVSNPLNYKLYNDALNVTKNNQKIKKRIDLELDKALKKQIQQEYQLVEPISVLGQNLVKRGLKKNSEEEGDTEYVSGFFVTIFNDFYEVNKFEDYNINYDYYIERCEKFIFKIEDPEN